MRVPALARVLRVGLLLSWGLVPRIAAANPSADDLLARQERECDANVAYLRSKIDGIAMTANVCLITGAVVSALGSALAGFLGKAGQRKSAAVIGALGAILTVVPKALPDKQDYETRLASADKHRTFAVKFRNQLVFAKPSESIVEAEKYASARFTDCSALTPPQAVPDFAVPAAVYQNTSGFAPSFMEVSAQVDAGSNMPVLIPSRPAPQTLPMGTFVAVPSPQPDAGAVFQATRNSPTGSWTE